MKQLTCEMCGSTDLIKQDGIFVCQACGTKYSIEEAKKLMVEGSVDVSGSTIKVDTSAELQNLYLIAHRAREENDSETAAKYYEMILQKEPNDWEAIFYSAYFRSMNCRIIQIESAARTFGNSVLSTISLIMSDNGDNALANKTDSIDKKVSAVQEIAQRVYAISDMLFMGSKNAFYETKKNVTDTNASYYKDAMISFLHRQGAIVQNILAPFGTNMEQLFIMTQKTEFRDLALKTWKKIPVMNIDYYNSLDPFYKSVTYNNILETATAFDAQIKKYDPNYTNPVHNLPHTTQANSSGGCYVATAVYGSYDCPEVWTLRRYRDCVLAETWYGRAFIRVYYAISPTIVRWFSKSSWFKNMWRPRLDKMVARLQQEGVEDTPYDDRDW